MFACELCQNEALFTPGIFPSLTCLTISFESPSEYQAPLILLCCCNCMFVHVCGCVYECVCVEPELIGDGVGEITNIFLIIKFGGLNFRKCF